MKQVVLASSNPGKVREIHQLLAELDLDVEPQGAFGVDDAEETGLSFVENAILKARNAALHTGLPAIADDSGIEVDILGREPGVQSARYAEGTDADRNKKLLGTMEGVPEHQRTARMVSVIAVFDPASGKTQTCRAEVSGRVTHEPKGERPFGYDPIFHYDEAGKTGGEMTLAEKDKYSHRGRALAKARKILLAEFA